MYRLFKTRQFDRLKESERKHLAAMVNSSREVTNFIKLVIDEKIETLQGHLESDANYELPGYPYQTAGIIRSIKELRALSRLLEETTE